MTRLHHTLALAAALTLTASACRASNDDGRAEAAPVASAAAETPQGAFAFTAADLAGYERGIAQEAALVRAAKERGRAAKTPAETDTATVST